MFVFFFLILLSQIRNLNLNGNRHMISERDYILERKIKRHFDFLKRTHILGHPAMDSRIFSMRRREYYYIKSIINSLLLVIGPTAMASK